MDMKIKQPERLTATKHILLKPSEFKTLRSVAKTNKVSENFIVRTALFALYEKAKAIKKKQ